MYIYIFGCIYNTFTLAALLGTTWQDQPTNPSTRSGQDEAKEARRTQQSLSVVP
jgi:hypothetical protein